MQISPHKFTHALVCRPSPKYGAYYAPRGISISDDLTLQQHDSYIAVLERAGVSVTVLPPHPGHHDCIFIEDTAIVWQNRALITRMNDVRQGEQRDVEAWLSANGFEIEHVPQDARIEGGDVLHLEEITLVGQSERTNDAGIEVLRKFMKPSGHEVRPVPVSRCLHLKSAMTYLGQQAVLVSSKLLDVDLPRDYERIEVAASEPNAGNALRVNGFLMVATNFPATTNLLRSFAGRHNVKLVELEMSETQKGDGALTCQSILW